MYRAPKSQEAHIYSLASKATNAVHRFLDERPTQEDLYSPAYQAAVKLRNRRRLTFEELNRPTF